jgi:hypothetical protein
VINVNEEAEIKIDEALIVDEPFDQAVELTNERVPISELPFPRKRPVPSPDQPDELVAATVEFAIVKELISETPSSP